MNIKKTRLYRYIIENFPREGDDFINRLIGIYLKSTWDTPMTNHQPIASFMYWLENLTIEELEVYFNSHEIMELVIEDEEEGDRKTNTGYITC